jgi:hypothetical protein
MFYRSREDRRAGDGVDAGGVSFTMSWQGQETYVRVDEFVDCCEDVLMS